MPDFLGQNGKNQVFLYTIFFIHHILMYINCWRLKRPETSRKEIIMLGLDFIMEKISGFFLYAGLKGIKKLVLECMPKKRKPYENGKISLSQKKVIRDLLELTLLQLSETHKMGEKYRINIMELNENQNFFEIKRDKLGYYTCGYTDTFRSNKKITWEMSGAPDAWKERERKCIYCHRENLDTTVDDSLKHLWSVAIKNSKNESVAVLNIDNILNDTIDEDIIEHISKKSEQLSELIGYYYQQIPT